MAYTIVGLPVGLLVVAAAVVEYRRKNYSWPDNTDSPTSQVLGMVIRELGLHGLSSEFSADLSTVTHRQPMAVLHPSIGSEFQGAALGGTIPYLITLLNRPPPCWGSFECTRAARGFHSVYS